MQRRIRALLRSPKPSPSLETRPHDIININAGSTVNNVGGHQVIITNIHTSTSAVASSSSAPPPSQAPFNDAPVDQLSVHFTGRKKQLALIAEAFTKRRHPNIPPRCVLFGNQGVGKSQLTYAWANTTYLQEENSYILWISATTVEKLYPDCSASSTTPIVHILMRAFDWKLHVDGSRG
jgi:chromosomal replication initiation ATPase DnaA